MVDTIIHLYKKQFSTPIDFQSLYFKFYSLITVFNILIQLTAVFGILAVVAIGSGLFFRYNSFSFTASAHFRAIIDLFFILNYFGLSPIRLAVDA